MSKQTQSYKFRYSVEPGEWFPPRETVRARPGVRVSKSDYGLADDLFIVSFVDGTYLMMSTQDSGPPSRETLLMVRDAIDHQLATHCPPGPEDVAKKIADAGDRRDWDECDRLEANRDKDRDKKSKPARPS